MVKVKKTAQTQTAGNLLDLIKKRAYELYQRRSYTTGNDWQDWFEAEKQIRQELRITK